MEFLYNTKITIFGDSISKGLYLDGGKIERVTPSAVDYLKNLGLNIDNKSVFGQTLKRVVDKGAIEKYLSEINMQDENMVVISLGGNDSDYNWNEVEMFPASFHSPKTSLSEFGEILSDTIFKLRSFGVQVVVCSLFPMDSNKYFKNVLSKKYDGKKILEFLKCDVQNIARHQELFNIECLKNSLKTDAIFLDYRSAFLNLNNYLDFVCDDGIHPNEMGQKMIADFVFSKICNNNNYQFCLRKMSNNFRLKNENLQ